jgi:hypothetical protein
LNLNSTAAGNTTQHAEKEDIISESYIILLYRRVENMWPLARKLKCCRRYDGRCCTEAAQQQLFSTLFVVAAGATEKKGEGGNESRKLALDRN